MDLQVLTSDNNVTTIPVESIASKNEEMVRRIVNKTDHPNPIMLMIYVSVVMIIIYYVYVTMIKQCYGGEWYSNNTKIYIKHNKWNDSIILYIKDSYMGEDEIRGHVNGNAIYVKHEDGIHMGVLKNKKIYWVGSDDVWQRSILTIL